MIPTCMRGEQPWRRSEPSPYTSGRFVAGEATIVSVVSPVHVEPAEDNVAKIPES